MPAPTPTQAWITLADTLTSAASALATSAAGGAAPPAGMSATVGAAVEAYALAILPTCGATRQPRVMVPIWTAEAAIAQRLSGVMPADVLARQPPLLDYVATLAAQGWDLYASCLAGRMV